MILTGLQSSYHVNKLHICIFFYFMFSYNPELNARFVLLQIFVLATDKWETQWEVGDAVASWFARPTSERALRVRALAGDIVLCSWARHCTLPVPLSSQVYKWVPANLMLGVTLRWTRFPSRGE